MGTHVSFIFRGYNPEFWVVKPFILHGFGVQGQDVIYVARAIHVNSLLSRDPVASVARPRKYVNIGDVFLQCQDQHGQCLTVAQCNPQVPWTAA